MARVITVQAPQYRQHALISDFLDLANLSMQEEATLATTWINDRPEGLTLQRVASATMAKPWMSRSPNNLTADVQHAINKSESLGSGKQLILHWNPSEIARDFSPHVAVLRRHFFRICISGAVCYTRAPSVAILTFFLAHVKLDEELYGLGDMHS